jgi:iron complex outermembrane receptor protein
MRIPDHQRLNNARLMVAALPRQRIGMKLRQIFLASVASAAFFATPALAADTAPADDQVQAEAPGDIVVTARHRTESAQSVPVAISVLGGLTLERTGAFNVNRPATGPTLQFYSSNPRNSAANIRGLGAPFGLTNDGIEQGVGIYVDDVYFSRAASSTFDFLDAGRSRCCAGRRARFTARTPRPARSASPAAAHLRL